MRDILFRGFNEDKGGKDKAFYKGEWHNGIWLKGSLYICRETTFCFKEDYDKHPNNTKYFILFDEMTDWGMSNKHLQGEVVPETVGQYTELTDKRDKQIFEGDIVSMPSYMGGKHQTAVYFKDGKFAVDGTNYNFKDLKPKTMEVIGNIFENPELLKAPK